MSASTTVKTAIMAKVAACPSVKRTYGHEELNPSGWPAVMITAGDMEGEFSSNAENSRVYAYRVFIMFPVGQDYSGPSEVNRLEYAEQVIATVIDEIINAIDTDFELTGNAEPTVKFVNAVDVQWGYIGEEGGATRTAELTLRVYTEKVVV